MTFSAPTSGFTSRRSSPGSCPILRQRALAASAPNRTPFNRLQRGERNRLGRDNYKDNVFPGIVDTEAFMDEFRVWRGARTGDQIRENLFRQLTGKEPDLVCLLNFDDQTPADKSPRANSTKLVGNARIVPAPLPSPGELIPLLSFSGRVTDGAGNPRLAPPFAWTATGRWWRPR